MPLYYTDIVFETVQKQVPALHSVNASDAAFKRSCSLSRSKISFSQEDKLVRWVLLLLHLLEVLLVDKTRRLT